MMINTLLIFPIVACLLMVFIKNKTFNTFMVNAYALVHFVITALLAAGIGSRTGIPYLQLIIQI